LKTKILPTCLIFILTQLLGAQSVVIKPSMENNLQVLLKELGLDAEFELLTLKSNRKAYYTKQLNLSQSIETILTSRGFSETPLWFAKIGHPGACASYRHPENPSLQIIKFCPKSKPEHIEMDIDRYYQSWEKPWV